MTNIFNDLPSNLAEELVQTIVEGAEVRIERIVSCGHASPAGFFYDQPRAEWVILLKGAARLQLEGETLALKAGDFINIPAHAKHRVEWTAPDEPTVWLAVHYEDKP